MALLSKHSVGVGIKCVAGARFVTVRLIRQLLQPSAFNCWNLLQLLIADSSCTTWLHMLHNLAEHLIQIVQICVFKSVSTCVSSKGGIAFDGAERKNTRKKYLLFEAKRTSPPSTDGNERVGFGGRDGPM